MSATVAERSGTTEHPEAGNTARQASAARRRGPARGARSQASRGPLRLAAVDGRVLQRVPGGEPVRTNPAAAPVPRQPAAATPPPASALPATPARVQPARPVRPVRLTRRGRLLVTVAAVLMVAALSVVLAGAAQALGHSGVPATRGSAITKVEVRPGQSLWTLAQAYDPNADPRQVIQEILQLNSLGTDQVQPGQVLWMPRA